MAYLATRPMVEQLIEALKEDIEDFDIGDYEVRVAALSGAEWEVVDLDLDHEREKVYIRVGARIIK